MKNKETKSRWEYRFDNYKRAFGLLRESIELLEEKEKLSQLEEEGIIQRFEYTMELAWQVMADYLESQNVVFPSKTPRSVIRKAFEANIISDGETWMNALDARNKMSHVYDFKVFASVILNIRKKYLKCMEDLYFFLIEQIVEK